MTPRELLTDEVMRDVLMVLPPPANFEAYRDEVRNRIIAALRLGCIHCNSPEQEGPCFGADRCMAGQP